MPAIVEFPKVVKEVLDEFVPFFANEPERRHFAEYLTGLIIAHKKNVSAINREFAATTDQSCLNRWITQADWDEEALNLRRIAWLQQSPDTRFSTHGVIPIDNVLVDHTGKLIEDVGYFWDHAEQRYKIAHDYLIINYACPSGKHYPLEFYRFVKRQQAEQQGIEFRDHNVLFRQLVDWALANDIPGDFTFDSWFTHKDNLNHIHALGRNYVGDLKFNRKLLVAGREFKAEDFAAQSVPADRKEVHVNGSRQWAFTKSVRIPGVDHKVRLVILWDKRKDQHARKILVTNRTTWEVTRILRGYRYRWTGTECFHRDGKQMLGMGDCQLRSGQGQTRHLYMVFLAYSVLMRQLRHGRSREWALERLTTIGEACIAVLRQTLSETLAWAVERIEQDRWDFQKVKGHLALP
ncbi:MAG TPA: IS701 family transposase [Sedimentisphaerales bacterium]|nr:IS701 family transposase [Sedimentisphaerales bacterium]